MISIFRANIIDYHAFSRRHIEEDKTVPGSFRRSPPRSQFSATKQSVLYFTPRGFD